MPKLNSSFGSSALPARVASFSFWLWAAISLSRIIAALVEPAVLDVRDVGAEKAFDGCEETVVDGRRVCPAGVVAADDEAAFCAGVAGCAVLLANCAKELMDRPSVVSL